MACSFVICKKRTERAALFVFLLHKPVNNIQRQQMERIIPIEDLLHESGLFAVAAVVGQQQRNGQENTGLIPVFEVCRRAPSQHQGKEMLRNMEGQGDQGESEHLHLFVSVIPAEHHHPKHGDIVPVGGVCQQAANSQAADPEDGVQPVIFDGKDGKARLDLSVQADRIEALGEKPKEEKKPDTSTWDDITSKDIPF